MAKKKESLTQEERLQAALVPEGEQPYKVPGNWCWTALKHISSHISDGSHNPPKDSGKGIPLLSATNIHDHLIDIDSAVRWVTEDQWIIENQRTKIETNDVLLTIVASIGRTAVVKNEQFALQRSVAVIKPKINSEFLSYYFETPYIQQFMLDNAKGTAQKGFYLNSLAELFCCVPPLPEQQRIVDRIESLFAKLDEAKQKVQDALDSFETRKAAILHKAFTGELTAQWRKEHGVGMESWETKKYSEICNIERGGPPRPAGSPEFYGGNIPFMKVADITRNTGPYVNSTEYTIKEAGLKKTRMVGRNTLLLTNSGATLGVPAICTFKTTFNDGIAAFLGLNLDTLLFHYYFWTSKTAALRAINKGAAQPNLNTDIIGNVEISLPRENEQCEIVRLLDNLLAKEQQAKEAAEGVLEQIDLIKKAILARAFRGDLDTNDPSEESAVELLKRVIERGEQV